MSGAYREGDRCVSCGYWWWERDGEGWHSLVPITYADCPDTARIVAPCATCVDAREEDVDA